MSEDEDCDELPMITVNSSASDSSTFAMPSAEELAYQRARELACEEELVRLRERAAADERAPPAGLAHSDSSGSEAEAALAAAVTALRVRPRAPAPPAAQLWAALAPQLAPAARALLAPLQAAAPPAHLVLGVGAALAGAAGAAGAARAWPDAELQAAGALLAVAALAPESRARRAAARTLHALVAECATPAQLSELARVLVTSFPSARIRLQLSDALRSGDEGSDHLAAIITSVAILDLLDPPAKVEVASLSRVADAAAGWRRLDEDGRYCCVQLAGRLLAARAGEEDARARLLAAMAPPATAADALRPDRLKVLVGASKLRLLFRTEK